MRENAAAIGLSLTACQDLRWHAAVAVLEIHAVGSTSTL